MNPVQIVSPREVALGGTSPMTVRRTLPRRERSLIGAWCFLDHYGPLAVGPDREGGMDVPPHPHTGLQTVSWLFAGEIEHRDSTGVVAPVHPGEVNLMTAGRGVSHSEVSSGPAGRLHGVQLWVALPEAARHGEPDFEHHVPPRSPLPGGAGEGVVFVGELDGVGSSPVRTHTPLLGAQLDLRPGARVELRVPRGHEHGVLVDAGGVSLEGVQLGGGQLGCLDAGSDRLELHAGTSGVRVVLLGGAPLEEDIVMWWNFIGRSHEEILTFREQWQAGHERFGQVPGYRGPVERLDAPPPPTFRLTARSAAREGD